MNLECLQSSVFSFEIKPEDFLIVTSAQNLSSILMNLKSRQLFGLRNEFLFDGLFFEIINKQIRFGHYDYLRLPRMKLGILDDWFGLDFDALQGSLLQIDHVDQIVLLFILINNYNIVLSMMKIGLDYSLFSKRDGK